jgi:stalled ribosome rescue protein Dom34
MANYVVFLDHQHANIFELHPDKLEEKHLKRSEIRNHNGKEKEQNKHKDETKFFNEVVERLAQAHEILLVGPGTAKTQFQHHLEAHHQSTVSKKIVGVETVDHPTDGQIVALAKKFFKAHLSFE